MDLDDDIEDNNNDNTHDMTTTMTITIKNTKKSINISNLHYCNFRYFLRIISTVLSAHLKKFSGLPIGFGGGPEHLIVAWTRYVFP